jgi:TatD DNase family protein
MRLASELSMPVIIHDREAHGDCFDMILKYPEVKGVFHSYSGSAEMAAELVKRGWYISFSGVLTFKNARKAVEVAESLPTHRILIETDTPYLAPHPFRGQINHSGLVRYTAEKLAEIKEMSIDDIADITFDNASRLFGIK